ncbi:hypothetical protein, partial [Methylocapsa sp. S129]|uniref:hypothetical protein n=1 Tax=Methylocapsa sp. S129 TaxID=1641869 RepID=UPI001AEE9DEA
NGTETIEAYNDLSFALLTTKGTATDPGDVILKSFVGAVRGGSIDAHGSVTANAVGIDFDQINANGDLNLNSSADIAGNGFTAVGAVAINAAGVVKFRSVSGAAISLSTKGDMTINNLQVATAVDIAANNLSIGLLSQTPGAPGPLELTITGFGGAVGNSANLTVDAPNGLYVPILREATAVITTDALQISMVDPTITKSMLLTTPDQVLWFNDVSSQPVLGNNVQFYQPDDEFYLQVNNRFVKTDSYIVQYDASAQVQQEFDGALINGPSFVRDFDRMGWLGDSEQLFVEGGADNQNGWQFPVEAFDLHLQRFYGDGVALAQPGQPGVSIGDSGGPTELLSDGLGFTIIVKKKPTVLPGALTHRGVHAHGKFHEAMR